MVNGFHWDSLPRGNERVEHKRATVESNIANSRITLLYEEMTIMDARKVLFLATVFSILAFGGIAKAETILPGDIFIAVAWQGAVYRITDGGDFSTATPFATGLSDLYGLTFSPSGQLFASSIGSGTVFDITSGGDFSVASPYAWGLSSSIRGIVVTSAGKMLVAELSTGRVMERLSREIESFSDSV